MAEAKSHHARAFDVAEQLGFGQRSTNHLAGAASLIARETFPSELLQAAKELLELRFVNRPKRVELRIERRMKAVLDLYEKEAPE